MSKLSAGSHSVYEGRPKGPIELADVVTGIQFGGELSAAPTARVRLDEGMRVLVDWTEALKKPDFDVHDKELKIIFGSSEPIEFFLTNHEMNFGNRETKFEAEPTREPVTLTGKPSSDAFGLIVNGPRLNIPRQDGLTFQNENLKVTLNVFDHTDALFQGRARLNTVRAITHYFTASTVDGKAMDGSTLFDRVGRLVAFLGFVKGTRLGFGQVHGSLNVTVDSYRLLGFTKHDRFDSPTNWFYRSLTKDLPTLFAGYGRRMATTEGKRTLGRAMQYYKAGNYTQTDATEIALLMSAAGLETMAYHVLCSEGGWSKALFKNATLADKLRACTRLMKVKGDPTEESNALKKLVKAKSSEKYDGFSLLADFRNGLTHAGEFSYTGEELVHAWFATQWLLEVLILTFLGYSGKYQDRRKQMGGFAGAHDDLPIEKTT
ncbi:MAG: hypothetical protein EOQ86_28880 [Mesorhizobium sp.]|uniref:HEPN domain-containing protein n=1 Tax=Mesorhizobium sp. TaxID=1871066 RepID=UPI000FEA4BC4|nr:HEPN domain-containing protein [Mesorhizobium sp.]RWH71149.1 MAG: hypothetical protein EOQ85_30075 [Mesorhizobium sp.]RWH77025.1 MAG: hypothetical protein EOQ86_28880 [Mesorhizobium sp.]RWH85390.1 MAG: hypothetical protein EOQ87_30175 [Mesorhizobium sp.]RWH92594.1 MAG: hypothetical protein EOQ88_29245 [Mesorhizobium sp.]RWH96806.1 MAG: hypothetical protein EOQ89_27800 [Mesorhizobium sp.]